MRRVLLVFLVLASGLFAWWLSVHGQSHHATRTESQAEYRASDEGGAASVLPITTTTEPLPESRDSGAAGSLTVRVTDTAGTPLSGSYVCVFPVDVAAPVEDDLIASGRAAEDGTVRLESAEWPEASVAVATKDGFLPEEVAVGAPANASRMVELRLSPGRVLSGRLLDRSDSPICGVRVMALGIGYRRGVPLRSPPLDRAYPSSGWGSGTTDNAGEFRIAGLGDEPCTLYLEQGWRFISSSDSRYALNRDHPVAVPGAEETYHALREAFFAFRAVDRLSGRPINAYLQEMHLPAAAARCEDRERPMSWEAYGLLTHLMQSAYRGNGVYAFPVDVYDAVDSTEGSVTFVGYQETPLVGAILKNPPSAQALLPEIHVTSSDATPSGSVSFVVPDDFPAAEFAGLPCFVRFLAEGKTRSASYYAERTEARLYRVNLNVGDYMELGVGTTRQARSGPFQVGLREGPVLHLEMTENRFVQLNVRVRDEQGRPLYGCGVVLAEEARETTKQGPQGATPLVNLGGIAYGESDRWPLEVLAPRSVLDRANAWYWLTVYKPGFGQKSVKLILQPAEPAQFVDIALTAEQRG